MIFPEAFSNSVAMIDQRDGLKVWDLVTSCSSFSSVPWAFLSPSQTSKVGSEQEESVEASSIEPLPETRRFDQLIFFNKAVFQSAKLGFTNSNILDLLRLLPSETCQVWTPSFSTNQNLNKTCLFGFLLDWITSAPTCREISLHFNADLTIDSSVAFCLHPFARIISVTANSFFPASWRAFSLWLTKPQASQCWILNLSSEQKEFHRANDSSGWNSSLAAVLDELLPLVWQLEDARPGGSVLPEMKNEKIIYK